MATIQEIRTRFTADFEELKALRKEVESLDKSVDSATANYDKQTTVLGRLSKLYTQLENEAAKLGKSISQVQTQASRDSQRKELERVKKLMEEVNKAIAGQTEAIEESTEAMKDQAEAAEEVADSQEEAAEGADNFAKNVATGLGVLGKVLGVISTIAIATTTLAVFREDEIRQLNEFVGSLTEAEALLTSLNQIADDFEGVPLADLEEAALFLAGQGVDTAFLPNQLRQLAQLSQALGVPVGTLSELWEQVRQQQELSLESLRRFERLGIPVTEDLAENLGVTVEQVELLASEGQITFDGLNESLERLTSSTGRFGTLLAEAPSTLQVWNNLLQTLQEIGTEVGNRLLPIFRPLLDLLNASAESFRNLITPTDLERLDTEQEKLNELVIELGTLTEGTDEWKRVRDELNREFPDFLNGLDQERSINTQLAGALNDVNDLYRERTELLRQQESFSETSSQLSEQLQQAELDTDALIERQGALLEIIRQQEGLEGFEFAAGGDVVTNTNQLINALTVLEEQGQDNSLLIDNLQGLLRQYNEGQEALTQTTAQAKEEQELLNEAYDKYTARLAIASTGLDFTRSSTQRLLEIQRGLNALIDDNQDASGEYAEALEKVNKELDRREARGTWNPENLRNQAQAVRDLTAEIEALEEALRAAQDRLEVEEAGGVGFIDGLILSTENAIEAQGRLFDDRIEQLDDLETELNKTVQNEQERNALLERVGALRVQAEQVRADEILQIRRNLAERSAQATVTQAERESEIAALSQDRLNREAVEAFDQRTREELRLLNESGQATLEQELALIQNREREKTRIQEQAEIDRQRTIAQANLDALEAQEAELLQAIQAQVDQQLITEEQANELRLTLSNAFTAARIENEEKIGEAVQDQTELVLDTERQQYDQRLQEASNFFQALQLIQGQRLGQAQVLEFLDPEELGALLSGVENAQAQSLARQLVQVGDFAQARAIIEADAQGQLANAQTDYLEQVLSIQTMILEANEERIEELVNAERELTQEEQAELNRRLLLRQQFAEDVGEATRQVTENQLEQLRQLREGAFEIFSGFDVGSLPTEIQGFADALNVLNDTMSRLQEQREAVNLFFADFGENAVALSENVELAGLSVEKFGQTTQLQLANASAVAGVFSAGLQSVANIFNESTEAQLAAAEGNDEKIKEIQLRAFERNKAFALAQVPIQTAQAILSVLAAVPGPLDIASLGAARIALIGATIVLGGIQAAAIAASQPPGFKEGVWDLDGPGTSTSDSIPARLSKGETVFPAKTVDMYGPALKAMFDRKVDPALINQFIKDAETNAGRLALEDQTGSGILPLFIQSPILDDLNSFTGLSSVRAKKGYGSLSSQQNSEMLKVISMKLDVLTSQVTKSGKGVEGSVGRLDNDLYDWIVKGKKSL